MIKRSYIFIVIGIIFYSFAILGCSSVQSPVQEPDTTTVNFWENWWDEVQSNTLDNRWPPAQKSAAIAGCRDSIIMNAESDYLRRSNLTSLPADFREKTAEAMEPFLSTCDCVFDQLEQDWSFEYFALNQDKSKIRIGQLSHGVCSPKGDQQRNEQSLASDENQHTLWPEQQKTTAIEACRFAIIANERRDYIERNGLTESDLPVNFGERILPFIKPILSQCDCMFDILEYEWTFEYFQSHQLEHKSKFLEIIKSGRCKAEKGT